MACALVRWACCDCGAIDMKGRQIRDHQHPCIYADEEPPKAEEPAAEPEPATEKPVEDFPDLRGRFIEWLRQKHSERSDPHENHASSLGDPCWRRIYLDRTGAERAPISDELAGIFQLGHDWEELARISYRRMGFRLELGQQRFRALDPETGEVLWVGMTDGVLVDEVTGERFAHDTKTARDAKRLGPIYEAKYRAQLHLYMSPDALGLERGMVVVWDKGTGLPEVLRVNADSEELARLLAKAKSLNASVKAQEPPPFADDPSCCKSCRYRGISCFPSVTIDPTNIIDDEGMNAALSEVVELEEIGKRHAELEEGIKDRFKGNPDGVYLSPGGISVRVKRNKAGACRVTWERIEANE